MINHAFGVSVAKFNQARRILEEAAKHPDSSFFDVDGQYVGEPMINAARTLIALVTAQPRLLV